MICRCWAPAKYGHDDASCPIVKAIEAERRRVDRMIEDVRRSMPNNRVIDLTVDFAGWTEAEARLAFGDR